MRECPDDLQLIEYFLFVGLILAILSLKHCRIWRFRNGALRPGKFICAMIQPVLADESAPALALTA